MFFFQIFSAENPKTITWVNEKCGYNYLIFYFYYSLATSSRNYSIDVIERITVCKHTCNNSPLHIFEIISPCYISDLNLFRPWNKKYLDIILRHHWWKVVHCSTLINSPLNVLKLLPFLENISHILGNISQILAFFFFLVIALW